MARGRWSVECGSNGNENSVGVRSEKRDLNHLPFGNLCRGFGRWFKSLPAGAKCVTPSSDRSMVRFNGSK